MELTYLTITLINCRDINLTIEGSEEIDDRPDHLHGSENVIDIKLGEKQYSNPFIVFTETFSLELMYERITISKRE